MLNIKKFGNTVRKYRNRAYPSQRDLALKLEVDSTLINKIENGQKVPSIKFFPLLLSKLKLEGEELFNFIEDYLGLLKPIDKIKVLLEILPADKVFVEKILNNHYENIKNMYENFEYPWNVAVFHFFYKLYFFIFKEKDLNNLIKNPKYFFRFLKNLYPKQYSIKTEELSSFDIKKSKSRLKHEKIKAGMNYINKKNELDYKIIDNNDFSINNPISDFYSGNIIAKNAKSNFFSLIAFEDDKYVLITFYFGLNNLKLIRKKIQENIKENETNKKNGIDEELLEKFKTLLEKINVIPDKEKKDIYLKTIENLIMNLLDLSKKDL